MKLLPDATHELGEVLAVFIYAERSCQHRWRRLLPRHPKVHVEGITLGTNPAGNGEPVMIEWSPSGIVRIADDDGGPER